MYGTIFRLRFKKVLYTIDKKCNERSHTQQNIVNCMFHYVTQSAPYLIVFRFNRGLHICTRNTMSYWMEDQLQRTNFNKTGFFCTFAPLKKTVNLLKPTGYVMHQQVWHSTIVCSVHTVFMCFVFIWEQIATCATYGINWLVFITEMKSVYSAVRTGSLNKAVCALSVKG
jgi:hypothetical protein